MPFPNINPVAFALGPLAVRWYALAYLFSIGFGALYGFLLLSRKSLWSRGGATFQSGDIFDFAFWAVAGVVLGGRLGYVLFYNLPLYAAHPLDALKLWDGGMSFYGGVAGLATAAFFYTRSRGGSGLSGFDLLATVAPIGLLLGRLANFINGELYGSVTTLPWGVSFLLEARCRGIRANFMKASSRARPCSSFSFLLRPSLMVCADPDWPLGFLASAMRSRAFWLSSCAFPILSLAISSAAG